MSPSSDMSVYRGRSRSAALISSARGLIGLVLGLAFCAMLPSAAGSNSDNSPFKAAMLANLVSLVQWPASAFNAPDQPIVLWVLDPAPFGAALQAIDGKIVQGRHLEVVTGAALPASAPCHMLFANTADAQSRQAAIQAVVGRAVLLVGETDDFARQEGMIGFHFENDRVVFEINPVRTRAAGLLISSRLIKLGRIVITGGR